jgi:thiamine transport system ATP-binding protein
MLKISDLTIHYENEVILDGVSLEVGTGEVVSLVGPSGEGKTTLLRVIAGIERAESGTVSVDGLDVSNLPTHKRGIGLVFQDNQLFPHLSVGQNIAYALRGMSKHEQQLRVNELLVLVGLEGLADRDVTVISGGEAKRVAVARSLAANPKVLLLDEPLSGLDGELHDRLLRDLSTLLAERNTTVVHVTHDRNEASIFADRIVDIRSLHRPSRVARVTTEQLLPLRMAVLRDNTPSQDATYKQDNFPGCVHLGIYEGEELIACSSWIPQEWPLDETLPAIQLKGMAVAKRLQGSGVGAELLSAGVRHCEEEGAHYIWARARDSALNFYTRNGFAVFGEQFVDEATGMGHHLVMKVATLQPSRQL